LENLCIPALLNKVQKLCLQHTNKMHIQNKTHVLNITFSPTSFSSYFAIFRENVLHILKTIVTFVPIILSIHKEFSLKMAKYGPKQVGEKVMINTCAFC